MPREVAVLGILVRLVLDGHFPGGGGRRGLVRSGDSGHDHYGWKRKRGVSEADALLFRMGTLSFVWDGQTYERPRAYYSCALLRARQLCTPSCLALRRA